MEVGDAVVPADRPFGIHLDYTSRLNYAIQQNDVPVVRLLRVENLSASPVEGVVVGVTSEPEFSEPWECRIASIPPGSTHNLPSLDLVLSPGRLANLAEREAARLHVEVRAEGGLVHRRSYPVELLAYNEWSGIEALPELLAAFVLPNHPSVAGVLSEASRLLEERTGDGSLTGYQTKSPARARATAGAVFGALQNRGIAYVNPPASYEETGQKIRTPDQVLEQRLGTCLDLACLYGACLEQAGLHSIVVMVEGHAFAAAWLRGETFPEPAVTEPLRLRKRVDLDEIVVVETTAITSPARPGFESAAGEARRRLEKPEEFRYAVDIAGARKRRIRPLPLRTTSDYMAVEPAPGGGPGAPDPAPVEEKGEAEPTSEGEAPAESPTARLERWKRKLLDLSLRNRLLNFRESRKTLPLLLPDAAEFEDLLSDGEEFVLHSRPGLMSGEDPRDAEVHRARTGEDAVKEFLRSELGSKRLHVNLTKEELDRRLVEIYRTARLSMEESGANTLYLALGFLSWYESPSSTDARQAPLLLLPLKVDRKSAREGFRVSLADDEARVNITLLQKLREEFGIGVLGLETLPQDATGLDVPLIFRRFREAVVDFDRWDVVEEAHIGHFSFTKYLMWVDLQDRAPTLLQNDVVRHLVETPTAAFDPGGPFPDPSVLDETREAARTFCLRDADSSQLAAVFAAADGRNFVLEGPPGTGKSQTITNLIAQSLAEDKRVLFVAEKQAALNVVHKRLTDDGLAPFCLELHSNKTNKQAVIRQLGEAMDAAGFRSPEEWEARAGRLDSLRRELNAYVQALHRPREFGESVFRVTSRLIGLKDAPRVKVGAGLPEIVDRERLAAMREAVGRMEETGRALGELPSHPWRGVRLEEWEPSVGSRAAELASSLEGEARALEEALVSSVGDLGLPPEGWSGEGLAHLEAALELLLGSPRPPERLLSQPGWEEIRSRIGGWIGEGLRRDELRVECLARFEKGVLALDLEDLQRRLKSALGGTPPFSWFGLWGVRRRLKPFARGAGLPSSRSLVQSLDHLMELRDLESGLSDPSHEGTRLLGRFWNGGEAGWGEVERVAGWAGEFRAILPRLAGPGPEDFVRVRDAWVPLASGAGDLLAEGAPLRRDIQSLVARLAGYRESRGATAAFLDLDEAEAWGGPAEPGLLLRVGEAARRWQEHPWGLRDWCAWRRARSAVARTGLEPLARACETGELPPSRASRGFERSFGEWWLERTTHAEPLLKNFFSPDHQKRIEQFRALDQEVLRLAREVVVARLSSRIPPPTTGRPSAGSEVGLLHRELKKQRRHTPVRRLVQTLPNLLPRIKPCLLMSPLSVAQYLDPAFPQVDIVVFDEASQIPVWDAVGSIARGKQVIVVGDSKQLPPTMFFEKMGEEETVDDLEDVVELESILDECTAAGVPRLYLEWHYRSRHESLIAFSNYHYYENRLLTFPAAADRSDTLGVSLVRVPGVYDRGKSCTNLVEARAVVADVVRRLRDPARNARSIGIVTFSSSQQAAVEDLLEEERRNDPSIEEFFSDRVHEPVFVKNLENVQGDERDVILFSVGYGPDVTGRMTINFGPLNRDGGQRRLNVAITRAREQVVMYSSFGADQIDLSRTRAVGVAHLKTFLDYAARGAVAIAEAVTIRPEADFESPFEKAVHDALVEKGWEVDLQVGCSGYRIDLAVRHPDRPGAYLMGIECDGASYHSGRTARDRDRLRESVLRSLGWSLHRIWSTDWWLQPEKVLETVHGRLREEQERSPHEPPVPPSMGSPAEGVGGAPGPAEADAEVPPGQSRARIASAQGVAEPLVALEVPATYEPYKPEGRMGGPEDFYGHPGATAVLQVLRAVVAREGPVSVDLAARRTAAHWDIDRVTKRVRNRILEVARSLRPGVRILRGFLWPEGLDPATFTTYRVPTPEPDSQRSAEDVPLEEAANAALAVLRGQVSLPTEELAKETARLLGFQRMGRRVQERMAEALKELAKRDGIEGSEGRISLRE